VHNPPLVATYKITKAICILKLVKEVDMFTILFSGGIRDVPLAASIKPNRK
jgi:hypothetical protein